MCDQLLTQNQALDYDDHIGKRLDAKDQPRTLSRDFLNEGLRMLTESIEAVESDETGRVKGNRSGKYLLKEILNGTAEINKEGKSENHFGGEFSTYEEFDEYVQWSKEALNNMRDFYAENPSALESYRQAYANNVDYNHFVEGDKMILGILDEHSLPVGEGFDDIDDDDFTAREITDQNIRKFRGDLSDYDNRLAECLLDYVDCCNKVSAGNGTTYSLPDILNGKQEFPLSEEATKIASWEGHPPEHFGSIYKHVESVYTKTANYLSQNPSALKQYQEAHQQQTKAGRGHPADNLILSALA